MTSIWLLLPIALAALFGVVAPRLARRLPPHVGTPLLSVGGLLIAAGSAISLALIAFDFVAQAPGLAQRAGWSDDALRQHGPVTDPVGALAFLGVLAVLVRVVRVVVRQSVAVHDAHRLAGFLPGTAELSVVASSEAQALAVPGRPGRIVVTTGLLRRMGPAERRALLDHERAHLAHRHHLHHAAARIAAAGSPLLRRLPAAVALGCERWADEDAARTSRRETVAAALISAAQALRTVASPVVLAAAGSDVGARLGALRSPAPRLAVWRLAVLGGLVAAVVIAVAIALQDTERLFELAQGAYRAGRR